MIYTSDNVALCMINPPEWYAGWRDEQGGDDFRTISLSLCGPTSAPLYSAVMLKMSPPFRGKSWLSLTKDELSAKIDELAAADEPFHPYLIAATGAGADVLYAACFRKMDKPPLVKLNFFASSWAEIHEEQKRAGRIPISIDSFGTPDDIRYCGIWIFNREGIAWNAEGSNDAGDLGQQRCEALNSIDARPELVAMTPTAGVARIFVDNRLKHGWECVTDLSGNAFMDAVKAQADDHRQPIRISATVTDEVRYSAIFAKSDEIRPRTFRISGPAPIGLDQRNRDKARQIDRWMESYMREHHLRGAAVAIVEGTRLVYTKGYTFAESDYPDIEPTTLFRMGSVSKTFCAVAVWALLARTGPSRESLMQDILGLTAAGGAAPADDRLAAIKLIHLLESRSGIDQLSVRNAVAAVRDDASRHGEQPLNHGDITEAIAGKMMLHDPGTKVAYGRTDYFLLSLVAAKLAGVADFETALSKAVLDPLHMTRTRASRSTLEMQPAAHAPHHAAGLATGTSAVHRDGRHVPVQYGHENYGVYDGAGGLSSAVVDVARLCAMFCCRKADNPVMEEQVLLRMLRSAVAATPNPTGAAEHFGFHGFDWAYDDGADHFTIEKSGINPGVRAGFKGSTRDMICIIARNGEDWPSARKMEWAAALKLRAGNVDWGGADLFPLYDMPPLRPRPIGGTVRAAGPSVKRRQS